MPQSSTSNPLCNILSTYEFLMLMKYPGTAFEGQAGKFNSQQLDTKNSRRTKVGEQQNLCPIVPKLKIDYMCQFYLSSSVIAKICECQAGRKWSNPSPSFTMAPPVPLDAALIGPFRSNTEREGGLALGQILSKANPFQPNLQWFLHVISTCPTGPSNLNIFWKRRFHALASFVPRARGLGEAKG